mgnify:CR=1 FL=1
MAFKGRSPRSATASRSTLPIPAFADEPFQKADRYQYPTAVDNLAVKIIGPGGAGKTTTGELLAELLGLEFFDLDHCFMTQSGDIDQWITTHGYKSYARQNVENYLQLAPAANSVCALSSGFMTYPDDVHAEYAHVLSSIANHPHTFVLLPSLHKERCVAETVRRQLARLIPMASPEQEEAKIRIRFEAYQALSARKIHTMRTPAEVASEIAALVNGP